ncbi:hypothetical protein [Aliarcobacter butzleri]|uniref:hypothetical protein n=1 Tax=Aliarcobacter butzleri TaxID=28197 RepID=UPI0021B64214|nr:hypothetical protein [Aliarcobacter butzleri]MCT7587995.1 hypothetical protein [Aliarcobacter butzleri]
MNSNNEIIIKIEESLDASKKFNENNLLQKKAIEKIKKLLKSRLDKTTECDDRKHDTITILGERGSGKTSLLLNLETILEDIEGYKDQILILDIIDPTLFETKQNILISIISLIANEVKDKSEEWSTSLIELGDGLKLLDGVGNDIIGSDIFADGALILEKGLDHSTSGINLEKNLKKFINESLTLLNKKMFILIFDDIDTNIDKGWMVLETIRKYLTSCKLQVFVSGDWNLYSSLVRMKQWENFDRKIIPDNEWQEKKYLIDDLEEQYLIKVLKPEYRIYLENFYQLTKKAGEISVEGFEKKEPLESIYQDVSKILFNFQNKLQQEEISNLIKQLPIRTNMKIFYAHLINKDDVEELINAISNVFITNTSRFNFTHLDYENLSPNAVLQEMAKKLYLLSNEKFSFEKLIQFPMNLSNKDINLLLMVINLHLTRTISTNVFTFFEWLTRFEYLEILGKDKQTKDEKNDLLSKLKYDSIISMEEQIDLISDHFFENKSPLIGFKPTYADNKVAKDYGYQGVNKFQENDKLDEKFILSIIISKSGLKTHAEQTDISIINIFSFLNEFLQQSEEEAPDYLVSMFERFQIEDDHNLLKHLEKFEIYENKLYKSLLEWHKLKNTVKIFSITQINRIWKEFIKKNMNEFQDKKFVTVKDFISTQIILFLNLLVSEILFNKGTKKFYSSSSTSPTNLYKNISEAYGKDYSRNFYGDYEDLDLFKFMYLCPLFYCLKDDSNFVKPKQEYWIGSINQNRILTAFSTLGIQGGSTKIIEPTKNNNSLKEENIENIENINIYKYIGLSDLQKITSSLNNIDDVIKKIRNGEINNIQQLWNKIKPSKTRITAERKAILERFMFNIKNELEIND